MLMGTSLMHSKCIEGSEYKWTVCAIVSESVGVVLALNMVPHIASRPVCELHTNATHWQPCIISGHKLVEVFWFGDST